MGGPLANKFTLTLFPHPPFEYGVQIVACPANTLEPDGLFGLDSFITAKHVFIDGLVVAVKAGSVPPKLMLALQVKAIAALQASNVGLVVSVSSDPAPPKLALALQARGDNGECYGPLGLGCGSSYRTYGEGAAV